MNPDLVAQLQRTAPLIRRRWEEQMRLEPVSSPLANADKMAMFIPDSIADVIAALSRSLPARPARRARHCAGPACDCGHNPYRAYFKAGEKALVEAVVLAQTACHDDVNNDGPKAEVADVLARLAQPKIDAFCTVCLRYRLVSDCRYVEGRPTRQSGGAAPVPAAVPEVGG